MKIGDKIKHKDDNCIWLVEDVFRSFVIISNGKKEINLYKSFWNEWEKAK